MLAIVTSYPADLPDELRQTRLALDDLVDGIVQAEPSEQDREAALREIAVIRARLGQDRGERGEAMSTPARPVLAWRHEEIGEERRMLAMIERGSASGGSRRLNRP